MVPHMKGRTKVQCVQQEVAEEYILTYERERERMDVGGNCIVRHFMNRKKLSRYRPRGFQEVKVPRFRHNGTGWC